MAVAGAMHFHNPRPAEAAQGVHNWEQALRSAQEAADKGEFDRARELLLKEVAKLGDPHPDPYRLILTLNELGLVYSSLGQFSSAERAYRRAIQRAEESPDAGGLVFAKLLDGLASVYLNVGRVSEAERLRVRALERLPSDMGRDHPERAWIVSNLGTVYLARGKRHKARQAFEQALAIFETAYGRSDGRTCRVAQNLGVLTAQVGRYSEAAEYLARSVSGLEARLGRSHPVLVKPLINQSRVHLRLKRPADAGSFALRAIGIALIRRDAPVGWRGAFRVCGGASRQQAERRGQGDPPAGARDPAGESSGPRRRQGHRGHFRPVHQALAGAGGESSEIMREQLCRAVR